jgi:hypothetical protein
LRKSWVYTPSQCRAPAHVHWVLRGTTRNENGRITHRLADLVTARAQPNFALSKLKRILATATARVRAEAATWWPADRAAEYSWRPSGVRTSFDADIRHWQLLEPIDFDVPESAIADDIITLQRESREYL